MEEVKKENEKVSKKIVFEFESNNICIARKQKESKNEVLRYFLANIFHFDNEKINECENTMKEDGKRIVVVPYARDLAKSLVYRTTCYLNQKDDDNYTVYIKED